MTDRELFIKALDALEYEANETRPEDLYGCNCLICKTIEALRDRLAQTEPGPVTHTLNCVCGAVWDIKNDKSEEMVHTPDTTPPQRPWVGLTDEERKECIDWAIDLDSTTYSKDLSKMIEHKLKEKNT